MNQATQRMLAMYNVQREEYIEQEEQDVVDCLEEECEQQEYCVVASDDCQVRSSSDHGLHEHRRKNYCETIEAVVPIDNSDALYRYPSMFQSGIIYTRSTATQTQPSRYLSWTQTRLGHACHQILNYLKSFLCTTSFSWTQMVAALVLILVVVVDVVMLVLGHRYYGLTAGEMACGVATISSVLLLIVFVFVCPTCVSSLCKLWFAVHVTYADDWAREAAVCMFNMQVQPVLETFDLTHITKNVNEPVFDWWFIQGLLLSIIVHYINRDEEEDEDEEMNYKAEGQEDNGPVLTDVVALSSISTHHSEDLSYSTNEPCEALIEVAVWENNSLVYERREVYGWAEDPERQNLYEQPQEYMTEEYMTDPGRQNLYEQPQEYMTEVTVGENNQISLLLPVSESYVTP